MSHVSKKYNIRVYALVTHEEKILVTDEFRFGMRMTKFPGGGHEWGEGLAETVVRECREELGQQPVSIEHFYTTDFFVQAAFREGEQLISIYYKVVLPHPEKISAKEIPFDFEKEEEGAQIFRWIRLTDLKEDDFTFPIDKFVV
ncbi:MAG TPA: NUDIX domain-containing protein, partial [Bacteroidia bacterium]|nr:NUDIX domain-containing protein [Bacteroidia bacterium]